MGYYLKRKLTRSQPLFELTAGNNYIDGKKKIIGDYKGHSCVTLKHTLHSVPRLPRDTRVGILHLYRSVKILLSLVFIHYV